MPPVDPMNPAQQAMLDAALKKSQNPAAQSAANFRKMASAQPSNMVAPTEGRPEFKDADIAPTSFNDIHDAFNKALKYHLSLPDQQRAQNSERATAAIMKHLSTPSGNMTPLLGQNTKTEKETVLNDGTKVMTTGLTLSPAYKEHEDALDTCVNHASCDEACLGERAGRMGMGYGEKFKKNPVQKAGFNRTQAFLKNPEAFITQLHNEIGMNKAIAAQQGKHLGIRLNVLSDIPGYVYKSLMDAHPDVTFYDYSKSLAKPVAPNHHLTYSSTGISQPAGYNGFDEEVINPHGNFKDMANKMDYHPTKNPYPSNVSMVFSHKMINDANGKKKSVLPTHVHYEDTGKTYRVVDGNIHDFTPAHTQPEGEDGVIIGLTYKDVAGPRDGRENFMGKDKNGKPKMRNPVKDSNGFIVPYDPQLKRNAIGEEMPTNHVVVIPKQPKRFKPQRGSSNE